MDDATLAKWLREEWPRVEQAMEDYRRAGYSSGDSSQTVGALTALLALLRDVAEATEPFIHLQDKGDYALGIITTAQVDRLVEVQARLRGVLGEG